MLLGRFLKQLDYQGKCALVGNNGEGGRGVMLTPSARVAPVPKWPASRDQLGIAIEETR